MSNEFLKDQNIHVRQIMTSSGHPLPLPLWKEDEIFQSIMEELKSNTMVDLIRCFMLYQLAIQAAPISGNVAEVGVWKGGTAKLLEIAFESRGCKKNIHLFDTFSGLPEISADQDRHFHKKGDFNDASLDYVRTLFQNSHNIHIYPGIFPESAKALRSAGFCFVHIDVDLYKSALDACSFFYEKLAPGGIMAFDDYGFPTCPGVKTAVDEFFSRDHRERPIYLPTGQCIILKR